MTSDFLTDEIAFTEIELERAREELNFLIKAIRKYHPESDAYAFFRYGRLLRDVVRLERYGYGLAPLNPMFQPQERLQ